MPKGGRFTDPVFRHLLLASKQFIYASTLASHRRGALGCQRGTSSSSRGPSVSSIICSLTRIRFSGSKMSCPTIVKTIFKSVLGGAFSASYKYNVLHVLQRLFQYREVMIDGLVMDPFQGRSVRKFVGYSHARQLETQTQVIPDEILGPLVRGALEYVDRFADYLLDTCDAVEDIRDRGRKL